MWSFKIAKNYVILNGAFNDKDAPLILPEKINGLPVVEINGKFIAKTIKFSKNVRLMTKNSQFICEKLLLNEGLLNVNENCFSVGSVLVIPNSVKEINWPLNYKIFDALNTTKYVVYRKALYTFALKGWNKSALLPTKSAKLLRYKLVSPLLKQKISAAKYKINNNLDKTALKKLNFTLKTSDHTYNAKIYDTLKEKKIPVNYSLNYRYLNYLSEENNYAYFKLSDNIYANIDNLILLAESELDCLRLIYDYVRKDSVYKDVIAADKSLEYVATAKEGVCRHFAELFAVLASYAGFCVKLISAEDVYNEKNYHMFASVYLKSIGAEIYLNTTNDYKTRVDVDDFVVNEINVDVDYLLNNYRNFRVLFLAWAPGTNYFTHFPHVLIGLNNLCALSYFSQNNYAPLDIKRANSIYALLSVGADENAVYAGADLKIVDTGGKIYYNYETKTDNEINIMPTVGTHGVADYLQNKQEKN